MQNTRINIIGGSGSGTSTIGEALAEGLSLPHFESDDYFHAPSDPPFQSPRDPIERCELLCRDLVGVGSWILSGGVVGWEPQPELDFTCVVFLHVPTPVRMQRLRRRERQRFGNRIDKGGDMFLIHQEFIEWASRYDIGDVDGKTLARHAEYLDELTCPVFEFRGELTISKITDEVLASLREGEDES